jgi:hypothetical protein
MGVGERTGAAMGFAPHPEQREDETFVGNHQGEMDPYLSSLRTARLGNVAYYIDGKKIPLQSNYRPLFVGRAESDAYSRLMEARLSTIRRGN